MGPIVLYSNGNQECDRARALLETLKVQIQEYKLNNHFTERAFISEFGEEAEYPQVSIGYKHIGGLKDVLHYMKENGLIK
jgi:glutaredoxin|tara:strand:- start:593 stop:832 length:240 start_codon:yes stop_codon:yes gene_type:complete